MPEATKKTLIKKHLIRPFLNAGTPEVPDWVQIKKATEFTRAMNPTTEERDYIADERPTTELTGYKPSEALSITMYKGEKDFDLMYKMYKERAIGDDAKMEFLMVYIFDSVEKDGKTYYYADKCEATVTVDELNTSGSTLSCTVYENGTPVSGSVEITDGAPVFTEGPMPEADPPTGPEEDLEEST